MGLEVVGLLVGLEVDGLLVGLKVGDAVGVEVGGLGSPLMHASDVCPP